MADAVGLLPTGVNLDSYVWQLVLDKYTNDLDVSYGGGYDKIRTLAFASEKCGMWSKKTTHRISEYVWQHTGFWHIARSQVMVGSYGDNDCYHNDLSDAMFVNHLEVTFSPTWSAVKAKSTKGATSVPGMVTPNSFLPRESHRGVILADRIRMPSALPAGSSSPRRLRADGQGVCSSRRCLQSAGCQEEVTREQFS